MAKTPVPLPNVPVKQGASPFMPVFLINHPPANLGNTKPYSGPREDGSHAYLNNDAVTPIRYNGQTQTGSINVAKPKPPRNFSPGATPPSMSQIP